MLCVCFSVYLISLTRVIAARLWYDIIVNGSLMYVVFALGCLV